MMLRTFIILITWTISGFIGGWLGYHFFETTVAAVIGVVIGVMFISPIFTVLRRALALVLIR
ncbi:MAG: hypothetical protein IBX55_23585 [Methyloprofundus sp.]|nr:hypothetical protein [Methyloprofundus sp.]